MQYILLLYEIGHSSFVAMPDIGYVNPALSIQWI